MLLPGRLDRAVRLGLGCAHHLAGLVPGISKDCVGLRSGLIADLPRGLVSLAAGSRGGFSGFGKQRVAVSKDALRGVQLSVGRASRSASSRSRTCSRGTTQEADIGTVRAVSTTSTSSFSSLSVRACVASAIDIAQPLEDERRHQRTHVPTPSGDVLYQARGQEAVLRIRRHEQRVDTG